MKRLGLRNELQDFVSSVAHHGFNVINWSEEVNESVDFLEDIILRHMDELIEMKETINKKMSGISFGYDEDKQKYFILMADIDKDINASYMYLSESQFLDFAENMIRFINEKREK